MQQTVYTIGHSTHSLEEFVGLLSMHGITALCDVRSTPYSRIHPQFNHRKLKEALRARGIVFAFLGKELGARSEDPSCYDGDKVQYDRLANTELFRQGLGRVQSGMKRFRLVLMCAEKEPLECHRTILVARHLTALGIDVQHIHANGKLESHDDAMSRLAKLLRLPEEDLFHPREDLLDDVYRRQEKRIVHAADAHAVTVQASAAG